MSFGQFQFRRDTAANWTSANPTLLSGEMGIETDTSKYKIGNGTSTWTALAYGGTQGSPGVGVPTGGTINQILAKNSSTDFDDSWKTFDDTIHGTRGGGTLHAAATTSTAGFMSSTDKTKLNGLITGLNGWIDVTQQTAPVLTSNSGSTNNTNLAAIMTAASSGSTIYFPGGFYPFSSVIAIPGKVFVFQGAASGLNGNQTGLNWTSNVAGDLVTLTGANYYTQFRDITFLTSVVQTAGAVINTGDNANINFYRCTFTGLSASLTLKDCINYTGTHAGEISVIDGCVFTSFTGTGIIGGSNLSTVVVNACTMNGAQVAACGINVQIGGAFQIDNSDIIGCTNNLLINPIVSTVVASVFCTNTYFDSSQGSCIKITGAGATVRTKFSGCSFTTAATASPNNAVEVSSTYAYGSLGQGLDFVSCNVLNTFGTAGTGIGFNITGAADFSIIGCSIAAWATGISVTPASSAGMTQPLIEGNAIGPCGGYAGNTTAIVLNAGSFAYGPFQIQNNNLSGNTTPLTDSSTMNLQTGQKSISGNIGMLTAAVAVAPAAALPLTTVTKIGSSVPAFANATRLGTKGRITARLHKTAATASTLTLTLRNGINDSSADAAIATLALAAGTAATGAATVIAEFVVVSATTAMANICVFNNGATGVTAAPLSSATTVGPIAITNINTASFWGLYGSLATVANMTIDTVNYEIVQQ